MKKLLLLPFLFMMVLFYSCKKTATLAKLGTITATIDGVNETFNTAAVASITQSSRFYFLSVTGYNGTAGSSDHIAITIVDDTLPIATGTYTGASKGFKGFPGLDYSQPGGYDYDALDASVNPMTIKITSISTTNVQGTFSGTLLVEFAPGAPPKPITNGRFNINL